MKSVGSSSYLNKIVIIGMLALSFQTALAQRDDRSRTGRDGRTAPPEVRSCVPTREVRSVQLEVPGFEIAFRYHACLFSFDLWNDKYRNGPLGDGASWVNVSVEPNCQTFNECRTEQYNRPTIPVNKSWTQMVGGSQILNVMAGPNDVGSARVVVKSQLNNIDRQYFLQDMAPVTCIAQGQRDQSGDYVPRMFSASGIARSFVRDRECNESYDERTVSRGGPGLALDTLSPKTVVSNDSTTLVTTSQTEVVVNVSPLDFPLPLAVTGTVSHTEGHLAVVNASSRYFSFRPQLVSQVPGRQEFDLSAKINPVISPNRTNVSFDPVRKILTIQDPDLEGTDQNNLSLIDPNNKTKYQLAVYVKWDSIAKDEKFGNILQNSTNQSIILDEGQAAGSVVTVDLDADFKANGQFRDKLAKGDKDWAIYVEVTAARTNKYVLPEPSVVRVTEIKIGKKFIPGSVTPNWTDFEKYKEKP